MAEQKDREIWVGEHRLYLGEGNILHITVVGDVYGETADAIREIDRKLKSTSKQKLYVLGDLNKAGKQSSEAKKACEEVCDWYVDGLAGRISGPRQMGSACRCAATYNGVYGRSRSGQVVCL